MLRPATILYSDNWNSLQTFPHSTPGEPPQDCTLAKVFLMSNPAMILSKRLSLENAPVTPVPVFLCPTFSTHFFQFLLVRSTKDLSSPKPRVLSCFPKTLLSQRPHCFPWHLTLFWWPWSLPSGLPKVKFPDWPKAELPYASMYHMSDQAAKQPFSYFPVGLDTLS